MPSPKDWSPKPGAFQDPNTVKLLHRIQKAIEKADLAYWAEIVKHFPEIHTGDFFPEDTFEWNRAMEKALLMWLLLNLHSDAVHSLKDIIAEFDKRGGSLPHA